MARTSTRNPDPTPDHLLDDDSRDRVVAAADADLQVHHQLLLCLEQTRRAQVKLAQDWAEDWLTASGTLTSSTDQRNWLLAPVGLAGAAWMHLLAAQGTMLAAWTEFECGVLDQMRAQFGIAKDYVWPHGQASAWGPGGAEVALRH